VTRRAALVALAAVVLAVFAAFHPLWLHGDSCMAAQGSPGVTLLGPAAATSHGQLPLADAVAAYIDEPLAVLAKRQLGDGHWPWWNPHNGLGVPLFGNWQSALLSPLRWLVLAFPEHSWAFDLTYVLRLLVAGVGACLLALRLGEPAPGAAASGACFALTGYFLRYLSMHHLNGEVWLPWLWLTADRLAQRRTAVDLLAFVSVAFCVVVGGNPQPVLLAALGTAGFWLARRTVWGGGVLWVILGALPAVLLSAGYWLAGLEYVRESVHHHSASFGRDGYTAAGALGFLLPEPYATPPDGKNPTALVAPHFGFLPAVLACVGLGFGLGRSVFLWVVLVVGAGKLANLWGTGWLGDLPGLALTKLFKYGYPLPALALALLAGAGVARLAQANVRFVLLRSVPVLVLLAALLCAGALAARASATLSLAPWSDLALCLALGAALVAAVARAPRTARPWIGAALVACELVAAYPSRWLPRLEPFAKPDYLRAIREREGASRTFAALGMLIPNQNAVFAVDDIRLHDGVFPRRYAEFVRRFLNPNVRHWPVFTGEDLGERVPELFAVGNELHRLLLPQQVAADIRPSVVVNLAARTPGRYLDLVNVEYFILPGGALPLAEAWPKDRFVIHHADAQAVVVRRLTALPRAFFPARIERVADERAAFDAMAADTFDPRAVAYLEGDPRGAEQGPSGTARVVGRPAPGDLTLAVQTSAPGWLVASVYPYPGLVATVDGQPAEVVPANGTLSAVFVPFGRHEVRFTYVPRTRVPALWSAAAGALVLFVLALAAAARGRATGAFDHGIASHS